MARKPQFGVALAASPRRVDEMIENARLAETMGADLVSLADHPYIPNELETWTTLATLAARTERIPIASNVLNLALRPPVMLAKAAATLQFLSAGRYIMGLGSGMAEQSAALGGSYWTPRESVAAVDEAVSLMRRLWASGEPVDHAGTVFTATQVQSGPQPRPDIPVWVGAFGPKMLTVTGARADGWLPTNAFLDLADVPAMQHRIDDAATEAGRSPDEVRRVFNVFGQITEEEPVREAPTLIGPADFWMQTLRRYRTELGFDSFVFWPHHDRVAQTELFLEKVRPGVE